MGEKEEDGERGQGADAKVDRGRVSKLFCLRNSGFRYSGLLRSEGWRVENRLEEGDRGGGEGDARADRE